MTAKTIPVERHWLIRRARPEDASAVSAVALESKAHWGYAADAMEKWRPELAVTPAQIAMHAACVADVDGDVAGFFLLCRGYEYYLLEHLWVRPSWMGRGIGSALLRNALQAARVGHATRVRVVADPHAAGFYARQGGVRVGAVPAPLPGAPDRELPIYEFGVGDSDVEPRMVIRSAMTATAIRPIQRGDRAAWLPLWDGYNAFYGRKGATALPAAITDSTWQRFFDPAEPVFGLVADSGAGPVGFAHYLFHRSTTRIEPTCYLQDLFTVEAERRRGIGRALIEGVYQAAATQGIKRVYWQTHTDNAAGRLLYDKVACNAGFIVYGQDVDA